MNHVGHLKHPTIEGGLNDLKWIFAIPFILLGAFLFSLTIDGLGNVGNIIMKSIGFGCIFFAGLIVRIKKEKRRPS
ncbi:hypothetical protein [Sporosarcina cascadiensis]|uniref:hypothetical protein n=1 Tax=Sporosarcina cascadiensis TaxID=2660747 RepID=UPI00129ACD2C|nr:hypothetical protein [Sporosarcina cascadiensis]